MLRRNLLHIVRYPGLTMFVIGAPVVFLLLFVFVFGGTLGAGLPGVDPAGGREAYVAYVMPGILAMTIAGTAGGAATTVAMDMTEGITARFRTMAISRAAVLAGHVLGNTIQAIIGVVVVLGVGLLIGFRSTTGPIQWVAAVGMIVLIAFAISWLGGRDGDAVEVGRDGEQPADCCSSCCPSSAAASCRPSRCRCGCSGSRSTSRSRRSSRPSAGCCSAPPLGWNPVLAIGWCVVITVAGYAWSMAIYERKSVR